jgi:hypothetical protein
MRTFRCSFAGRKVGAIGITISVSLFVKAEDEQAARLACYNTHEHIAGGLDGIRVHEVTDEEGA